MNNQQAARELPKREPFLCRVGIHKWVCVGR